MALLLLFGTLLCVVGIFGGAFYFFFCSGGGSGGLQATAKQKSREEARMRAKGRTGGEMGGVTIATQYEHQSTQSHEHVAAHCVVSFPGGPLMSLAHRRCSIRHASRPSSRNLAKED